MFAKLVVRQRNEGEMLWLAPEYESDESIKVPSNWLFNHYYQALTALFRTENALRAFVFVVLKEQKKSTWSDLATEDGGDTTIGAIAKRLLNQDKAFGSSLRVNAAHAGPEQVERVWHTRTEVGGISRV